MQQVIQELINNKHLITGVCINDYYYHVNCVLVDDQQCFDEFCDDDVVLNCFELDDNNCYLEYEFTIGDIKKAENISLYKEVEIISKYN